jgi:hypothetical protein
MNFLVATLIFFQTPVISAPEGVNVQAHKLGKLEVTTEGKTVKWIKSDPKLDCLELNSGKTLIFTGEKGIYKIMCYTAVDNMPSDPITVNIVIGGDSPSPVSDFQKLYNEDSAALELKKNNLKILIDIYKLLSVKCIDNNYKKLSEIQALGKEQATMLNPSLMKLRMQIAEMNKDFVADKPLDDELRKKLLDRFKDIISKLEVLK